MRQLLDASAKGVYTISATPFTELGDIDWASVDSLVEFYLQCGVQGLTILGMMGEAQKLSDEESAEFTRHFLRRVDGRVPVVRVVRVEGHDHAAGAHVPPVTAGEGLRAGLGHPEGIALVGVPVIHVRGEVRVHRLDRHAVRAPVPGPVVPGHVPIIALQRSRRRAASRPDWAHDRTFRHQDRHRGAG